MPILLWWKVHISYEASKIFQSYFPCFLCSQFCQALPPLMFHDGDFCLHSLLLLLFLPCLLPSSLSLFFLINFSTYNGVGSRVKFSHMNIIAPCPAHPRIVPSPTLIVLLLVPSSLKLYSFCFLHISHHLLLLTSPPVRLCPLSSAELIHCQLLMLRANYTIFFQNLMPSLTVDVCISLWRFPP